MITKNLGQLQMKWTIDKFENIDKLLFLIYFDSCLVNENRVTWDIATLLYNERPQIIDVEFRRECVKQASSIGVTEYNINEFWEDAKSALSNMSTFPFKLNSPRK